MLLSEILLNKAIETDDTELYKVASEIKFTEDDKEIMEKDAGLWGSLAGGILKNNTVRNALGGAAVGAGMGALQADKGEAVSGAIKGGLLGGILGGGTTLAKNVSGRMSKGLTMQQSLASEGRNMGRALDRTMTGGTSIKPNTGFKSGPSLDPSMPSYKAANPGTLPTLAAKPPVVQPALDPKLLTPLKGTAPLVGTVKPLKEAKFRLPKPEKAANAPIVPIADTTPNLRPKRIG